MLSRVFILEDNQDICTLVAIMLKRIFSKIHVESGATPSKVFSERKENFDLLILDLLIHTVGQNNDVNIQYPEINPWETGLYFLELLRLGVYEHFGFPANMPVIIQSTFFQDYYKPKIDAFKIVAYIEKPYREKHLSDVIKQVAFQNIQRGKND
jgi:hypothetical protein